MLRLTDITKEYPTGGERVVALRQVSLEFRKNEFVAILGPSGCGKTTLLNIIGGLDQYTDGDLSINGISTKKYKDGDWDAYRNHSVGFVFQSYNLIPHQTVLSNVELALSISGVSKRERRARAIEALKKVGLGDQLKKKPNQMSGGQMQRVAIARALVNDPEILLADEPTGALDSETSVQVMELLKEIAKDRLVVMVTHNPELADQYATRIVRLLDGKVIGDSDPYHSEEQPVSSVKKTKKKRPSMSFFTSLSLSLKNLLTKKGRTILTAFAGSIGIIGISLIFAVSNGMKTYIDDVQEDTLSSYPLTLEATTVDLQTLMQTFMGVADTSEYAHENDKVYSQAVLFEMINAWNNMDVLENDLKKFKEFVETELAKDPATESALRDALSGVQYSYDLDLQVYTKNVDGSVIRSDTSLLLAEAFKEFYGIDMSTMMNSSANAGGMTSMMTSMSPMSQNNLWCEMLSGKDGSLVSPVIEGQYDLIYGSWPNDANEILLVLNENNELNDLTLYALGLIPKEEIDKIFDSMLNPEQLEVLQRSWSYEEICSRPYRVVLASDCWQKGQFGNYVDLRESQDGLKILYNDYGFDLRVTGIIRPKEDATAAMLTGSIAYTKALTELVIARGQESALVAEQKSNPKTDIFTGLPFKENLSNKDKDARFRDFINKKDVSGKASVFVALKSMVPDSYLEQARQDALKDVTREKMIAMLVQGLSSQPGAAVESFSAYLESLNDEALKGYYLQAVDEMTKSQYVLFVETALAKVDKKSAEAIVTGAYQNDLELIDLYLELVLKDPSLLPSGASDVEFLASLMDQTLSSADTETCALYYDNLLANIEKEAAFRDFLAKSDASGKAATFVGIKSIIPESFLQQARQMALQGATRESMIEALVQGISAQTGASAESVASYLENMSEEELKGYYLQAVDEISKAQYASSVGKALATLNKETAMSVVTAAVMEMQQLDFNAASAYVSGLSDLELVDLYLNVAMSSSAQLPDAAPDAEFMASLMDQTLAAADGDTCAKYYDEALVFSESTYEQNLIAMGAVDLNSPSKINLFSATFEAKDTVKDVIAQYNESVDELSQIRYTDIVGIMMSSVTTIIDAITYVLIAFVSISLVVSSIMIAVITLISVQERTKEIGILRAIGASKRNVSNMFNAETMIIGFASGVLGIVVTWLLCFVINFILHALTGIPNLSAQLSLEFVVIMIGISVLLTLISGLIPSRSAAKKDPVVALRTE